MSKKMLVQCVVGVLSAVFAFGCATTGGGTAAKPVDDKAAVAKVINDWAAALASKNIESILTFYSDKFSDAEGRDKTAVKEFIQGAIDNGYLDGVKVDLAAAQITVAGDQATASGVRLFGDMGEITITLGLAREAQGWRIVSSSGA